MADITIEFNLTGCDSEVIEEDFVVCAGLAGDIEERAEELIAECEEDDVSVDWNIITYDDDYPSPDQFDDLDDYAEFVELADEFGEAFQLRWEDIGELTKRSFEEEYWGCFDSYGDFAERFCNDCYDIPAHLENYIDYEKMGQDYATDYSVYEGNDGLHFFRD